MRIVLGRVVNGRVEIPDGVFVEGDRVAVLQAGAEPVRLSEAQERELSEALEAIERGEFVDGDELLAELRSTEPG